MVLSIDEKTQVQALDRTQPVLPIEFAATEKRTHDYIPKVDVVRGWMPWMPRATGCG